MARRIDKLRSAPRPTPRGWPGRWWALLSLAIVAGAGVATVLAVHDTGAFELEGNAVHNAADDWADVFNNTDTAFASTFTNDGSLNATIFTGGGSKDPIDINQWAWKDGAGGLPDKDNLLDSFAARYSLPPGPGCPDGGTGSCDILFFGSDRYDNSGDAQQGFWFFQNPVSTRYDTTGDGTPDSDCPQRIGGGTGFCDPRTGAPATHVDGDLLIISNFSNGGTTSTISVYVWDATVNGNLRLLQSSAAANCATAGQGDGFCGIVNPGPGLTAAPWPFLDKSGNSSFLNGEFYEGGVNLSLLGLSNECFASVASETRSSTSTTATLKDFVLGQFANCTASLTTTPSVGSGGTVSPGTSVTDVATVLGAGTPNPPTPTGSVTFFLCGPIATGVCSSGGTQVGSAVALANSSPPVGEAQATSAAVNTAASPLSPGRYCFRAEWPGDDNYPTPLVHAGSNNDECFLVQDSTSGTSAQNWLPNDSATITSAAGTALSGTLTFTLHSGLTCGGTALYSQSFTLSSAASPATRSTTNASVLVTDSGSYSWRVSFVSDNPNVVGTNFCRETTSLTIVN